MFIWSMFDNNYNLSKCENLVVVTRTKKILGKKKKKKLNVILSNFFLLNGLDITAWERASSGLSIVNNLIGPFKSQIPNSKRVILFPVLSVNFSNTCTHFSPK